MNTPKSPGFGPTLPAGSPYPKKIHVVRNRDDHLMAFHQRGRTYIVGFTCPMHVKQVCEVMSATSRMSLSNHLPEGSPYASGEAKAKPNGRFLDLYAHFTLEKRRLSAIGKAGAALADAARKHSGRGGCAEAPAGWSVAEMPFGEFVGLPLRKNLGIVMPMDLMLDDRRRLIFESHVIDPCRDPRMLQLTPIR